MAKYKDIDEYIEKDFLTEEERDALLLRECRLLGLKRYEDAARTEEDFREIIKTWDMLDANRERRERAHEIGRPESLLEWNSAENPFADIFNYDKVLDVQRQKGEFIDTIFDYPEGMCQLVLNGFLTWILDDLKLSRKHLLYYMVIRDYSTTEYAEMMGMTDRNARGIKKTAIKKIQKEFKEALEFIDYMLKPMTIDERYFLEHGPRKKPKKHEK